MSSNAFFRSIIMKTQKKIINMLYNIFNNAFLIHNYENTKKKYYKYIIFMFSFCVFIIMYLKNALLYILYYIT